MKLNDAVKAYLNDRYPGLVNDCVAYRLARTAKGELYLTVQLIVKEEINGQADRCRLDYADCS
jgi:hypothetical protein